MVFHLAELWSDEELRAAVVAYIDMLNKQHRNEHFVKKHYYSKLSSQIGCTEKACEYRMENISYVLELMGRTWITGLKPHRHVSPRQVEQIEKLI